MKRAIVAGLGVLVSAVALVLAFARVEWSHGLHLVPRVHAAELRAALAAARPGWLVAFTFFNVGSLVPRAVQLRALARRRDGGAPDLVASYHACAIGLLAQNVLPGRISEAVRVVALRRAGDVSTANAAAAVVFGRVLDLISLILVVCVPSLILARGVTTRLRTVAVVGTAVGVALVVILVVLYRARERLTRAATGLGPRLGTVVGGFLEGLSALGSPRRLWSASAASVAAPLVMAACYASALEAFGMGGLRPGSSLVLVATILFAIAIPSAPSAVGVYHAAVTWLLPTLGASEAQAAAFALVTHALGVVTFTAVGAVSLSKVGAGVFSSATEG
jgi:uncharacterized membrane protein YbhN (UPF0104 family)